MILNVEYFIKSKKESYGCEDDFVITDDFVAVIDGVTSKTDFKQNGKTLGELASAIIKDVIQNANKQATCQNLIKQFNDKFAEFYETSDFNEDKIQKGLGASVIIYSEFYREIWMIGDCQGLVDGHLVTNPKKSDLVLSDMRSLILTLEESESKDIGREYILPWILKSTCFANNESTNFGYSVVNGQEIPSSLIKTIKLDNNTHEIVLASDGYPVLMPTIIETERELKRCMEEDPKMYLKYPSTKGLQKSFDSFDDRTFIKFTIKRSKK